MERNLQYTWSKISQCACATMKNTQLAGVRFCSAHTQNKISLQPLTIEITWGLTTLVSRLTIFRILNPIDFWQEVSVIFRWSAPAEPNGIIQRYELSCWVTYNFTNSSRTSCSSTQISTKSLEFTLQNLPTNKIHNFQVSFCTS